MGIFDALNTSVGGLQAQSFALQNISGNIANASTVGYKGIDTSFEDLIPDSTTPNRQVAGGVTAYAQPTISTQGNVSASTVATNMSINGDGFFSVQSSTGVVDNSPVFSGVTDYTRRGDFQVNDNGNLVNGAGYYLMGVTVDPKTGNPIGNVPKVLQFQNNFVPASATTAIQYAANLPTTPSTTAASTATSGTLVADGGLNFSDFGTNPLAPGTPTYADASVTGGSVSNQAGGAVTSATKLSGTGDALTSGFAAGDTLTVDNQTISFYNSSAGGTAGTASNTTYLDLASATVGDLLGKIATITGVTPTVSSPTSTTGAITLHTGSSQDLSVIAGPSSSTTASSALVALGFTSPVSQARGPGPTSTGTVVGNDLTTFTNESISGGAVTVYNSAGTPVNVQLRWAKTDSSALGSPHVDTWNLFYQSNSTASGTTVGWTNVGTNFTFNADGSLASPTSSAVTIPGMTINGQDLGTVTMNVGAGALTQYANTNGTATINTITQNGYAAGQLQSIAINNNGLVVGTFSNGQNLDLASVTLSHFNGTNYLKALDGGAYAVTDQSGPAIAGASGTISGSSLEGSNTDIADEFTKLIVTQQAYSANTKVITTANEMVQDLLNVLR